MTPYAPASLGARQLLSSAARTLRTADPVGELGGFIDESLQLPAGAQEYRRPHAFETRFNERHPRTLAFVMEPGDPRGTPQERAQGTTRAMRRLVHGSFGPRALHWLDGRSEPLQHGSREAWLSPCFDGEGLREAQISYAWGPGTSDSLAGAIHETIQEAMEAMPSLRPALTSVRCVRSFGSQEITFRVEGALRLADLRPLMDRLGLGAQHTRLVNMLAFVLGARFVLPPGTALVTLRPSRTGMEMRVDVDVESIPDIPPNVASLLQMQLAERPQSLAALEEWVAAMTTSGTSPGELSVLSVLVRPDLGPRLAIHMRPSVLVADPGVAGQPPAPATEPTPKAQPPVAPVPRPPQAADPQPAPVAAGLRSPWDPRP